MAATNGVVENGEESDVVNGTTTTNGVVTNGVAGESDEEMEVN